MTLLDAPGPQPTSKSDRELELERLDRLPLIPDHPEKGEIGPGVLLSDRIKYLCDKYRMIDPLREENLKAASYELSVGDKYFNREKTNRLAAGESLVIEPFDVVIIQTLETLNLPRFLIARWNLRIRWVYKGLLWVGAPQVDPGFRGVLACPLYNLSSKPVTVWYGDPIAAMDFVTTTSVNPTSKPYLWKTRTRIVLRDYEEDRLESALFTEAAERIKEVEQKFGGIESRVDTFTTLTFTAIAVLFGVLGLLSSRSSEFAFGNSSAWVAAIALWFALRSLYRTTTTRKPGGRVVWVELIVGLLLTGFFLAGSYASSGRAQIEWAAVRSAAERAANDVDALKKQTLANGEVERRLDSLQQQIDSMRPKPGAR